MKFMAPQWLWALAVLPLAYVFLVVEQKRRIKRFSQFAASQVWRSIVPELDWSASMKKNLLWLLAMAFVFVALARPQWGSHEETVTVSGLDVMIALDVSQSMEVEDIVPSRMKKSKHFIRSLLERLQGDRVGVVAFAGSSYLASPLTTDMDYVLETVDLLNPRMVVNQGTNVGIGLETAAKALDRGAEESGAAPEAAPDAKKSRIIILISDGEDHEEKAIEGAKLLKQTGARLYVFGIGTVKGGPIPTRDDQGQNHGYKRDRKGQPVISAFRPDALMQVAAAADGRYWNITPEESEVEELLGEMGALDRSDYAERRYLVYEDRFQYPLLIAVLLLLLEFSLPARKIVKKAAVVGATSILFLSTAHAGILTDQVPLDAYVENRKGLEAYSEGKIEDAARNFGSAQALDPLRPELEYNQGVVQSQQGNAELAEKNFESAAKSAANRGDVNLAARSYFNLGKVFEQRGDAKAATRAYLNAIETSRKAANPTLEAEARKNIELLAREQEKKKDQQKQDKEKQEQDKKEQDKKEQEKQDSKDKKDSGKDGKEEKQQQQVQQNKKQTEFKSAKLSKEDAERVMAELQSRERDLQAKLKKQRGTPAANGKDW
jgi:Ca-activated chloride channel homolog